MVAAPDYLARHGCPHHPRELAHHAFWVTLSNSMVSFDIDGQLLNVPVRPQLTANNGEVLAAWPPRKAWASPVSRILLSEDWLASGRLEVICATFAMPRWGYALLPGNKQIPHRVRVLLSFGRADGMRSTG